MRIKEFFSDIKTYILLIVFFIGIGSAGAAIWKLPKRVEVVEEKQEQTNDKVQSVANTLEQYIEVQKKVDEQKEKSSKEEKELMLRWIEQVSKK